MQVHRDLDPIPEDTGLRRGTTQDGVSCYHRYHIFILQNISQKLIHPAVHFAAAYPADGCGIHIHSDYS